MARGVGVVAGAAITCTSTTTTTSIGTSELAIGPHSFRRAAVWAGQVVLVVLAALVVLAESVALAVWVAQAGSEA